MADARELRGKTKTSRVPDVPICSWWGLTYCDSDLGCGHSGFRWEDSLDLEDREVEGEGEGALCSRSELADSCQSSAVCSQTYFCALVLK